MSLQTNTIIASLCKTANIPILLVYFFFSTSPHQFHIFIELPSEQSVCFQGKGLWKRPHKHHMILFIWHDYQNGFSPFALIHVWSMTVVWWLHITGLLLHFSYIVAMLNIKWCIHFSTLCIDWSIITFLLYWFWKSIFGNKLNRLME